MDITNFTLDQLQGLLSTNTLNALGAFLALPLVYYAVECFFGFRFFRIKCAIEGFAAGASFGLLLATAMGAGESLHIVLAVAVGMLFAWLAYKVYKFGVFFTTAITGFAAFGAAVGLVIAIVAGIIGVFLTKPAIIGCSAFSGGVGLGTCIFAMLKYQNDTLAFLVGLVLCAVGVVVQLKTTKHR